MDTKTALLAFTGDLKPALLGATRCDRAEAEELVRRVHPGYDVTPIDDDATLFDDPYPPDDVTYATVLAGAELLCDRRLVLDRPSELPEHLRKAGAGQRIGLAPDSGILENIGEPVDFERPYWAGEHPVEPDGDDDIDPETVHLHGFRVT